VSYLEQVIDITLIDFSPSFKEGETIAGCWHQQFHCPEMQSSNKNTIFNKIRNALQRNNLQHLFDGLVDSLKLRVLLLGGFVTWPRLA